MFIGTKSSPIRERLNLTKRWLAIMFCWSFATSLQAVDTLSVLTEAPNLERAESLYNSGRYEEAIQYTTAGQELDPWITQWEITKARSLLALGRYDEAFDSLQAYVNDRSYELRPRLLLREAALFTGNVDEARRQQDALGYLVNQGSPRYRYDPENIVAVGNVALLFDVEPKLVLENFFRRAQDHSEKPVSAFLGTGNLALSKDDYKLASKAFQLGLQSHPENVELLYGLACAYREGDRAQLIENAEKALSLNPRHAPTLILLAEHFIAAEAYEQAESQLDRALEVNPRHPNALSLKAFLAYFRNDLELGNELRAAALSTWPENPEVDYRIGQQLSRKYRFTEGSRHQELALGFDGKYNPARIQLAQDLLRLGRNDDAWKLAEGVYQSDAYNISAYNLTTLRDRLDDFATVESDNFVIRLSPEEAEVYGDRAVKLLEEAHTNLTERYGIDLPEKTTVEIYPNPADFETRTFGMPGNPGYLGVCFGPVFTINSPATRSANWEAVLYHEFCHTITLFITNNRMPRWLSEGISVFEEQIANPAWGQRMTASYRTRILSDQMQPISSMSSAFLRAESGEDVQFAYYQSYLVVEYIIQNYGLPSLQETLKSLGEGTEINEALANHLAPLDELDTGFVEFAKAKASQLASDYRFESNLGLVGSAIDLISPKKDYTEALSLGRDHLAAEDWDKAIEVLKKLTQTAGYLPGKENAHWPLSLAYRGNGDYTNEAATLMEMVGQEANRIDPVVRLLEIANEQKEVEEVNRWSDAWIAINPMAETPWRTLLKSATTLEEFPQAIEAASALLALETPDKPSLHYQMAQLTKTSDPSGAKRHVLQALEEAPRFSNAYRLLKELQTAVAKQKNKELHEALDLDYDFIN